MTSPLRRKLVDHWPELQNSVEEFARKLIKRNPAASIDTIARVVSERFHGHGVTKEWIARARREARVSLSSSPPPATQEGVVEQVKHKEPEPIESTKEERAKFLNEWALANPGASIAQARASLKDRFGMTMATHYIAETMRLARQIHDEDRRKKAATDAVGLTPTAATAVAESNASDKKPLQSPESIAIFARTMKLAGIRKIEIFPDGRYTYEVESTLGPA